MIVGEHSILFDCGLDWKGKVGSFKPIPSTIVITHEHPDHGGCTLSSTYIADEVSIPVIRVPKQKLTITLGNTDVEIVPHAVQHAKLHTTVLRVTLDSRTFMYAPDLLELPSLDILEGVHTYIGDGATVKRPMKFTSDLGYVGHASMYQQLTWCRMKDVKRVIFTHFGSWARPEVEKEVLAEMRRDYPTLKIDFAHDGWRTTL
jgi:ribonuclease BN (tRNA processing enzyme)